MKKSKGEYFEPTPAALTALNKLCAANGYFPKRFIISAALVFAAEHDLQIGFIPSNTKALKVADPKKQKQVEVNVPPEKLCELVGGKPADGVCTVNTYNVVPSGHVTKSVQSFPYDTLPKDITALRKKVLGPFSSTEDAEAAYSKKGI